jgi:IS30 family transposase
MDIRSKHLSSEDRGVILAEHNRGSSQRLIGQLLHRPASTICRTECVNDFETVAFGL